MAAQVGVTYYYILVKFDSPDGSTCCRHKYYNTLILIFQMAAQVEVTYVIIFKFLSPDGSTYLGHKYYNNLVNFDHPDGRTS